MAGALGERPSPPASPSKKQHSAFNEVLDYVIGCRDLNSTKPSAFDFALPPIIYHRQVYFYFDTMRIPLLEQS